MQFSSYGLVGRREGLGDGLEWMSGKIERSWCSLDVPAPIGVASTRREVDECGPTLSLHQGERSSKIMIAKVSEQYGSSNEASRGTYVVSLAVMMVMQIRLSHQKLKRKRSSEVVPANQKRPWTYRVPKSAKLVTWALAK